MAQLLKIEALGYRDVAGRFAKRSEVLAQEKREMVRRQGRAMVVTLRHYAPKATGEFVQGISYRTDVRGDRVTATIYVKGKHAFVLPFLVEGTKPHEIPIGGAAAQMAKGYPLHWISKSGEHHYAWSVWHLGTLPDPFIANAMDAMTPQFEYGLAQVARRVAWLS